MDATLNGMFRRARRAGLRWSLPALGMLALGPAVAWAQSDGPAWPMFNGPHGNFVPREYGVELVDDLSEARLLWVSEEDDIGVAKGPYGVDRLLAAGTRPHPGGRSSPIVAADTVFVAYYRPVGPPYARDTIRILGTKAEAENEALWDIWAIEADDVLVAIDAATGRTKWKAVERRNGVRIPALKRGDWGVSPAYFKGRVYSLGTTARLYCYDAASGRKHWEVGFGATHAMAAEAKAEALKEGRFARLGGWLSSLVVADGVLIVPTFRGHPQGLAGVDVANGKILWETPEVLSKFATPAVVALEGREYLLANSGGGALRLIDPRNGEVLWTVEGLGPLMGSLSSSQSHVIVNSRANPDGEKEIDGRWGALRIGRDGAELAWQLPDKPKYDFSWHLDAGPRRKVVARGGAVYIGNRSGKPQNNLSLYVVDERSGKILQEVEPVEETLEREGFNLPLPIEDRLMTFYDVAHGTRDFGASLFAVERDGTLERLSCDDLFPHAATTAYEVPIETPYFDGRIFFRTEHGTVVCYDLRADGSGAGGAKRAAAGDYEQIELVLQGAGEQGDDLVVRLHSRGGKLGRGWAAAPGGADTGIDHRLRRTGQSVEGHLRAVIGPVEYRYDVRAEARDGALGGTYRGDHGVTGAREALRGELEGEIRSRPDPDGPVRWSFNMWSLYTQWGHIRNPTVRFTLRDGKVVDGVFESRSGPKRGFEGRIDGGSFDYDGKRLRGRLEGRVVEGDAARGPYTFELDAEVHAGFVDGTVTTRKEGNVWGERPLFGEAVGQGKPKPGEAVYVVDVVEALTGDRTLRLYLDCHDGTIGEAVARGGNTKTHPVDAGGLTVEDRRLGGDVEVELVPGDGFPPGERALDCRFELQAVVAGERIQGQYSGRYGQRRDASGTVRGTVRR